MEFYVEAVLFSSELPTDALDLVMSGDQDRKSQTKKSRRRLIARFSRTMSSWIPRKTMMKRDATWTNLQSWPD
jgi:hypothetical protein